MIATIQENSLLQFVKPGAYAGTEKNLVVKEWSKDKLKICLIYPDLYEVGIANNAIRILYYLLNKRDDVLAERAYLPYPDFMSYLQKSNIPLFSIETRHFLKDFDIIAFTLPSELCYTNILKILELAQIPLNRDAREKPLVLAGGVGALNPEVLHDFIDIFFVGEAETAIGHILEHLKANFTLPKNELLDSLKTFPFLYIPGYKETAQIVKAKDDFTIPIDYYTHYLTPRIKSVHDRGVIEIMRGCPNNCRFCLAGYFYRPVRELHPAEIIKAARALVLNNGFEEISLSSLSTVDYHCINQVLEYLNQDFKELHVSISVSSLRIDKFSIDIARRIGEVRHTGLTFAPETGSQELRYAINKWTDDSDIYSSVEYAAKSGFNKIKLYFMIGLPGETNEDLRKTADMIIQIYKILKKHTRRAELSVTISNFVPKPHTAFQFVEQDDVETLYKKQQFLLDKLKYFRKISIKFQAPEMSLIEGIISRGDKNIGRLVYTAYKNGALLDQWSDYFDFKKWRDAIKKLNINLDKYTKCNWSRDAFPWKSIDIGIPARYYAIENTLFKKRKASPGCIENCTRCEGCSPATKLRFVHDCTIDIPHIKINKTSETTKTFRLKLSKTGILRYLSHNDYFTYIKRLLRSIGIIFEFSQGFHPHAKISSGYPGILGIESICEYFDIKCFENIESIKTKFENADDEISLLKVRELKKSSSLFELCRYEAYLSNKVLKLENFEKVIEHPRGFLYIFKREDLKTIRKELLNFLINDTKLKIIRFEQYKAKEEGDVYVPIL